MGPQRTQVTDGAAQDILPLEAGSAQRRASIAEIKLKLADLLE